MVGCDAEPPSHSGAPRRWQNIQLRMCMLREVRRGLHADMPVFLAFGHGQFGPWQVVNIWYTKLGLGIDTNTRQYEGPC